MLARPMAEKSRAVITACLIGGLAHMTFEASIIAGALDYTLYFLLSLFCGLALGRRNEEKEKL